MDKSINSMNTNYPNPQITVLMSVFNGEKFLKEAIDSILNQTYGDFEFVIINDGSRDSSKDIILSYNDSRIRLINNENNIGLIASLNKGLTLARGEYIARQDADDISLLSRLEKQVRFFKKNKNAGVVGTNFIIINESGEEINKVKFPEKSVDLKKGLLRASQFAHGSTMFKKKCIERVGPYREEFKHCEDYDLWLRFSHYYELANLQEYLYKWRLAVSSISFEHRYYQRRCSQLAVEMHKERVSRGEDLIQRGELNSKDILALFLNEREANNPENKIQGLYYKVFGYLMNNRTQIAKKSCLAALNLNKTNIKTWCLLLICLIKPILPKQIMRFLIELNRKSCRFD